VGKPRKHTIYPIFLPYAGCAHRCVYCNQQAATGRAPAVASSAEILRQFEEQFEGILKVAQGSGIRGEVAFFGGTFTALPSRLMTTLLRTVSHRVGDGVFSGIRFSTRPDGLAEDILDLLQGFPIRTVELGAQSLVDEVLRESGRGYGAAAVTESAARVRDRGWQLGLQLMLGLPGDTPRRFQQSVLAAVQCRPDFVRLYPTLVLAGTELAAWHQAKRYRPWSVDEAIESCVRALDQLEPAKIPVVRVGLHPDPELLKPGNVLAGPYHPSFGYLVKSRQWRQRVDTELGARSAACGDRALILRVSRRLLSEVIGPARSNVSYWCQRWQLKSLAVAGDTDLPGTDFELIWR
jgi:histone acetyltransferase (RNA polymerase elongator complex component)